MLEKNCLLEDLVQTFVKTLFCNFSWKKIKYSLTFRDLTLKIRIYSLHDGCRDGVNILDVAKRFLETVGIKHLQQKE